MLVLIISGGAGRTTQQTNRGEGARFDERNHWPQVIPNDGRRRCQNLECPKRGAQAAKTKTQCSKCGVGLCIQCFQPYHS